MILIKKRLIKSFILLIVALALTIGVSYAWISYSEREDAGIVSVGDITYQINGGFISETEIIYPSKDLVTPNIIISNQSTIETQIRLKITYTLIDDTSTSNKIYKNDATDDLSVVFGSAYVLDGDYWYYQNTSYMIDVGANVPVINAMYYDGQTSSNEYANENINIEIILQVKQADNVSWLDLTTYTFGS
jgi:hypothetical protein